MTLRLVLLAAGATAAMTVPPAYAQAPPGPPGPPPGNGADLPAPPGTAAPNVPAGTAAAIPATAGPGLLSGTSVALNRGNRTFAVQLACQRNGSLRISARRLAKGTLATAGYRCAQGRATARLKLSPKTASRLTRRKSVAATASVRQGGQKASLDFTLTSGPRANSPKGFWTDGHLDCGGAYLAEPDFTTAQPTVVSTRGWVAWYTARSGWHWLGTNGERAGRWDTWTATATGIAQFHPNAQPQPTPWTWGPISVPPGNGIYATGVYEIVYWVGGHPEHQWQYVNAGTTGAAAAGGGTLYCTYP